MTLKTKTLVFSEIKNQTFVFEGIGTSFAKYERDPPSSFVERDFEDLELPIYFNLKKTRAINVKNCKHLYALKLKTKRLFLRILEETRNTLNIIIRLI